MKRKGILSIIFCLVILNLISCYSVKQELTSIEKKSIIKVIDSMYKIDQARRLYFSQIDSLYNLNKFAYMNINSQKKFLGAKFEAYKERIDKNWFEIKRSDSLNTEKLIGITKRFGFPSNKRLGTYKSKAYFIFVHSPQFYFPQINSLIIKEYKEGRISQYKKKYIFWHLNGRKGTPPKLTKKL